MKGLSLYISHTVTQTHNYIIPIPCGSWSAQKGYQGEKGRNDTEVSIENIRMERLVKILGEGKPILYKREKRRFEEPKKE